MATATPHEPTAADTLRVLGDQRRALRETGEVMRRQVRAAVIDAIAAGVSESEAARLAGVDRMTVRAWTGKR